MSNVISVKVLFYSVKNSITRDVRLSYESIEDLCNGSGWLEGEAYADVYSANNTRPIRVEANVIPEPKHVINTTSVEALGYEELLNLFPDSMHDKLRMYTAEELFYVYKLSTFKPKIDMRSKVKELAKPSDVLFLQLREKLFAWLKDEIDPRTQQPFKPLSPSVWIKLGTRFKYNFKAWSEDSAA